MRNHTRQMFNAYLQRQAELNGVPSATEIFSISPGVQQTLETKVQESSSFLSRINMMGVDEMEGERLALGVTGPIASRTDTSGDKERKTRDVKELSGRRYRCEQTNYDTHVRYATLDAWAGFKDFQARLSNAIIQRCALDRIAIGWNGTHAAPDTNFTSNPLLQDVNKGWLQDLRDNAPDRVMTGGKTAGEVLIGQGGDYESLDGLAFDIRENLLDVWHTESADLVVIIGRKLMNDKLFPLVDAQKAPTEVLAASIVASQKRLGNMPAITVPYFPNDGMLVTSLDNLSIYFQKEKRRRAVIDTPKRDRIETFESSNDAYVFEDLGKAGMAANIKKA